MSQPTASLFWSLLVECPSCKEDLDLADIEDDCWIATRIFSDKWDELKGHEVTCTGCCHEFQIKEVEY